MHVPNLISNVFYPSLFFIGAGRESMTLPKPGSAIEPGAKKFLDSTTKFGLGDPEYTLRSLSGRVVHDKIRPSTHLNSSNLDIYSVTDAPWAVVNVPSWAYPTDAGWMIQAHGYVQQALYLENENEINAALMSIRPERPPMHKGSVRTWGNPYRTKHTHRANHRFVDREEAGLRVQSTILVKPLARQLLAATIPDCGPASQAWSVRTDILGRFNLTVPLEMQPTTQTNGTSWHNGTECRIDTLATDTTKVQKIDVTVQPVKNSLLQGNSPDSIFTATSLLVPKRGLTVMADIDGVLERGRNLVLEGAALETLVKRDDPNCELPGLFDRWNRALPAAHFHYTTDAPESFLPGYISRTLRYYPFGSFSARPISPAVYELQPAVTSGNAAYWSMKENLAAFPERKYVLFGDSTTGTSGENLAKLMKEYPDQVQCVVIRDTPKKYRDPKLHPKGAANPFFDLPHNRYFFVEEFMSDLDHYITDKHLQAVVAGTATGCFPADMIPKQLVSPNAPVPGNLNIFKGPWWPKGLGGYTWNDMGKQFKVASRRPGCHSHLFSSGLRKATSEVAKQKSWAAKVASKHGKSFAQATDDEGQVHGHKHRHRKGKHGENHS